MKRILAVLVLLALCGMAFSVTGKIFTTIRQIDGLNYAVVGTTANAMQFGDTGFVLNFDGFDVKYVMKAPAAVLKTAIGGTAWTGAANATSPGMIGIENIKAGDTVNVGFDVIWYTLGKTTAAAYTNAAGAGTTNDGAQSYNSFEIDPLLTVTLSDVLSLTINDHQAIKFYSGSAVATDPVTPSTNNLTVGGMVFNIPLIVKYSGIENLAAEAGIRLKTTSDTSLYTDNTPTTNNEAKGEFLFSGYAQAVYTVMPDFLKVAGNIGIASDTKTYKTINIGTTNDTVDGSMVLTIKAGVIVMPASKVTLRLNGGFNVPLASSYSDIDSAATVTTNEIYSTGAALIGWDPLVEFGGGFDVTENFNIGITGKVYWQPTQTSKSYNGGKYGSESSSQIINFQTGQVDDPASIAVDLSYKF